MKTKQLSRKFNSSTGCYKIDIYINGMYVTSTDQSKTCKEAKAKYINRYVLGPDEKLTAHFDRY